MKNKNYVILSVVLLCKHICAKIIFQNHQIKD